MKRRIRKATKAQMIADHWRSLEPDSVRGESDRIRARHGIAPLPESKYETACRAIAVGSPGTSVASDPIAAAAKLARERAAHERKARQLDTKARELARLAIGGDASVTAVARALGITRQRIYQLAA